ncbi:hypothetical protein ACHAQJ_006501 [Trichoderma viride]
MTSILKMLLLPTALLALVAEVAANQPIATAIKKQVPDANEKLFPNHLAFESLPLLTPFETTVAANLWLDSQEDEDAGSNNSTRRYRPAFSNHFQDSEDNLLRRAAEVLVILQNRAACPGGMDSCSSIGAPDKCCADGTYCTNVSDSDAEQVACCPNGATCGGQIGTCPSDAVSCSSELGGGCCIPGYVCVGVGCVPSASATGIPTSTEPPPQTVTQIWDRDRDGSTAMETDRHYVHALYGFHFEHPSSPFNYDSVGRDPKRLSNRLLWLPGDSWRRLLPHRSRLSDTFLPGAIDNNNLSWRDCGCPGK